MQNHFLIKAVRGTSETARGKVQENHPLKKLLRQLPQGYSLAGEVNLFNDVRILVKNEKDGKDLDCGTLGNPNVASLLQASSESSFGKGSETVYDENVRKGKEIKSGGIKFMLPKPDSSAKKKAKVTEASEKSFIDAVHDLVLENCNDKDFLGPDIDVQFYKLAIYEPGGHFQTHRDTVHSADHKATLLLEVKSDHKGGILTLQKNDLKMNWNLSKHETSELGIADTDDSEDEFTVASSENGDERHGQKPDNKGRDNEEEEDDESQDDSEPEGWNRKRYHQGANETRLKWLLFYTDIEHAVSPVTEGVRIVLQFDVYERSPGKTMEESEKIELEENEDEEQVVQDEDEDEDEDDEDEDADEENEDEENTGEDVIASGKPIDQQELTGPKDKVLPKIISILQKQLTSKLALVIPFYYLYTSQTIFPEKLKNIDKVLFDTLLAAGFPLALVSVELVLETDYDGSYSTGDKKMKIHDFPYKVYESGSPDSSEIKSKIMKKLPKNLQLTYVVSGLEAATLLESTEYSEYTGNEAAPGKYRYLCAAMIVFKGKNKNL
jgi:hypothetical protein